jgi:hypothetical protein
MLCRNHPVLVLHPSLRPPHNLAVWFHDSHTHSLDHWIPVIAKPLGWGMSLLCVIWLGVYSMSVGPIVYTLVAEIGSTRLRTQTVVLGRSVYYFGNIIFGGILQPKFMSPGDWNLKGKTVSVLDGRLLQ